MKINHIEKPTFIMMCGIPGSGKSYEAQKLAQEYNAQIFSSDTYRKQLFGDENIQSNAKLVFSTLYKDMINALQSGRNVIFDATNIKKIDRERCLSQLLDIFCDKIAYIVQVPLEKALAQNNSRDRVVPEDVIKTMYLNFQYPTTNEGFDKIITITH